MARAGPCPPPRAAVISSPNMAALPADASWPALHKLLSNAYHRRSVSSCHAKPTDATGGVEPYLRSLRLPVATTHTRSTMPMASMGRTFFIDRSTYCIRKNLAGAPTGIAKRNDGPRELPHEKDRVEPEAAYRKEPCTGPDLDAVIQAMKKEHKEQSRKVDDGPRVVYDGEPHHRAKEDDRRDER